MSLSASPMITISLSKPEKCFLTCSEPQSHLALSFSLVLRLLLFLLIPTSSLSRHQRRNPNTPSGHFCSFITKALCIIMPLPALLIPVCPSPEILLLCEKSNTVVSWTTSIRPFCCWLARSAVRWTCLLSMLVSVTSSLSNNRLTAWAPAPPQLDDTADPTLQSIPAAI